MPQGRDLSPGAQMMRELIESNRIDYDLSLVLAKAILQRRFMMPLALIAELIPCPLRTLERYVQEDPLLQAAGSTIGRRGGRGGAKLYPYWVIQHFFHLRERSNRSGSDEYNNNEEASKASGFGGSKRRRSA